MVVGVVVRPGGGGRASAWGRALVVAECDASDGVLWAATFCTGEGMTVGVAVEEGGGGGTVSVGVAVDMGTAVVVTGAGWVF